MKGKIKRRTFLKASIVGISSIASGWAILASFNIVIHNIIERYTTGMPLENGLIAEFIKESDKAQLWRRFNLRKRVFITAHYVTNEKLPYRHKYVQIRDEIVGIFLLSTDYFYNGNQPDIAISFTSIHNPHRKPCSNPFSSLYYPDVEINPEATFSES